MKRVGRVAFHKRAVTKKWEENRVSNERGLELQEHILKIEP